MYDPLRNVYSETRDVVWLGRMYFAKPKIALADPADQFMDIIPFDEAVGEREIGSIISFGNSGASSVGKLENLNVSVESDEASIVSTNDVTVVTGNINSEVEQRDRVETIVETVEEDEE